MCFFRSGGWWPEEFLVWRMKALVGIGYPIQCRLIITGVGAFEFDSMAWRLVCLNSTFLYLILPSAQSVNNPSLSPVGLFIILGGCLLLQEENWISLSALLPLQFNSITSLSLHQSHIYIWNFQLDFIPFFFSCDG